MRCTENTVEGPSIAREVAKSPLSLFSSKTSLALEALGMLLSRPCSFVTEVALLLSESESSELTSVRSVEETYCEAQIKRRGYFLPFNPDTAMASRRKSKKRKSDGLHNMGAIDESATEGSGAAPSAGPGAPSAAAAMGAGRGGSGGGLNLRLDQVEI